MSGIAAFTRKWRALAVATFAAAAVPAALLTQLVAPETPPPPAGLRWFAVWLMFTLLIAFVFTAGIVRMAWDNDGGENDISPWHALGGMVAVVAVCGLSAIPVVGLGISDAKYLLFGLVAIAVAIAVYITRPRRKGNSKPPDSAST
jgi:hypothetical protein